MVSDKDEDTKKKGGIGFPCYKNLNLTYKRSNKHHLTRVIQPSPTLVSHCARRLAACVSFGWCVGLAVGMSHTWWWPCLRGRPRPPLLSEGGAADVRSDAMDTSTSVSCRLNAAFTFLLCFLRSLGCWAKKRFVSVSSTSKKYWLIHKTIIHH